VGCSGVMTSLGGGLTIAETCRTDTPSARRPGAWILKGVIRSGRNRVSHRFPVFLEKNFYPV